MTDAAARHASVPLPRPVVTLGWVSFATDLASEAIYPLLPAFLTRVLGAGALSLGIIEGVAEAANSLLKVVSGHLSDRWRVCKPLVLLGYAISSAVRPLIAVATSWTHVLALRFADRLGKGVRGAPRDALLARFASPDQRGRVFGFNRAMDHAGAVAGPLAASGFLAFYPEEYRTLFAVTLIPGALVVLLVLSLPPDPGRPSPALSAVPPPVVAGGDWLAWHRLPPDLRTALLVILLFTLGNSTDAFLLLRLGDLGVSAVWIPALWAALHVVKSSTSLAGGNLSDRWGRRRLIGTGWIAYALVYGGFAAAETVGVTIALFVVYGLYFGLAEGPEKALVADLAPAELRGTAFGLYNAALGVGSLLASIVFGLVWTAFGARAAFRLGAVLALASTVLLFALVREPVAGVRRPLH